MRNTLKYNIEKQFNKMYICINGKQYPMITNIIKPLGKKGMKNLLSKEKIEDNNPILDLCYNYLNGTLTDNMVRKCKPEDSSYFNKLKIKLNSIDNIVIQQEILFSNTLKVGGVVPLVANFNDVLSVIYISTDDELSIDEMFLLCTAYSIMFFDLFDTPIEQLVILKNNKNSLIPNSYIENVDKYIKKLIAILKKHLRN